jgi:hypothetical protein
MRFWIPLCLLLAAAGCRSGGPGPAAPPRIAVLKKGAEVPMVLLRQLEAGDAREGSLVPFVVTEEVRSADGAVVLEKGAIAEGEVVWSRGEGTLSGMMNRPARLTVRIRHARASGGERVPLAAELDKPEEPYAFTRANTGIPGSAQVGASGDDPAREAAARALDRFFATGEASALQAEEEAREWLLQVSREQDLEAVRAFLDPSARKPAELGELDRVVRHIRDGSITKLAGGEALLALSALQELGRMAHYLERSLASRLKGRTIKAYMGTPVRAFVAEDVSVKVRANR